MRKYKYTEEDIIDLLKTNNEHVKYIDGFIDSRVHKAKFLCTKYNEVFYSIPASVYWKRSCPVCYKHRLKEENVIKNLSNNNPNIEYVSGYIEARKPATFRCKLCAYEWSSTAADVYKGKTRCPNCRTNLHANTIDDIEKKLEENNPTIEYVGGYVGADKKATFKCKKCGNIWNAFSAAVYRGQIGCPKCAFSKGEDKIASYLDSKNIDYTSQKIFDECKITYGLPFDFYIESKNICIEYDGEFHFGPVRRAKSMTEEEAEKQFEKIKIRDQFKNDFCKSHNIKLIRIPYTEFKNIESILDSEL